MNMPSLAPIVLTLHPLSLPHFRLALSSLTMLPLFYIILSATLRRRCLPTPTAKYPSLTQQRILLPSHQRDHPYQPVRECDDN